MNINSFINFIELHKSVILNKINSSKMSTYEEEKEFN